MIATSLDVPLDVTATSPDIKSRATSDVAPLTLYFLGGVDALSPAEKRYEYRLNNIPAEIWKMNNEMTKGIKTSKKSATPRTNVLQRKKRHRPLTHGWRDPDLHDKEIEELEPSRKKARPSPLESSAAAADDQDPSTSDSCGECKIGQADMWKCSSDHCYCIACLCVLLKPQLDALCAGNFGAWPVYCPGSTPGSVHYDACTERLTTEQVARMGVQIDYAFLVQHAAQQPDITSTKCPSETCRSILPRIWDKKSPMPLFVGCCATTGQLERIDVDLSMNRPGDTVAIHVDHGSSEPGCARYYCTGCQKREQSVTLLVVDAHFRMGCINHRHLVHCQVKDPIKALQEIDGTRTEADVLPRDIVYKNLGWTSKQYALQTLIAHNLSEAIHSAQGITCRGCKHRFSYLNYLQWADYKGLLMVPTGAPPDVPVNKVKDFVLSSKIQCPNCRRRVCLCCGAVNPPMCHFSTHTRVVDLKAKATKDNCHRVTPYNPLRPVLCPERPSLIRWEHAPGANDVESLDQIIRARAGNIINCIQHFFKDDNRNLVRIVTLMDRPAATSLVEFYWGASWDKFMASIVPAYWPFG